MLKKVKLQKEVVYGPVASRRLGRSLGVNPILPGVKACSFNCVYCQYGPGVPIDPAESTTKDLFVDPDVVKSELERRLSELEEREESVDFITIAGNGEPAIHPRFPEIVEVVTACRDELAPGAGTAILTNGTALLDPAVMEAVGKLDEVIVKLDAVDRKDVARVNRPFGGFEQERLIEALSDVEGLTIQAMFFDGRLTNATGERISKWIEAVGRIRPGKVQIYSIDRAPAVEGIRPVSRERLLEIASLLESETGIEADVY